MRAISNPTVILVPGWNNSGPEHWQTLWQQKHPAYHRVKQRDWISVKRNEWMAGICHAVSAVRGPILFVAHSLGCLAVVHCAQRGLLSGRIIHGALFVAPPDVEAKCQASPALCEFAPIPANRLPFPSIVVGSDNDPYASAPKVERWAAAWGSRFVNLGRVGHINTESGHGHWPEGEFLLEELVEMGTEVENVA